MIWKDYELEFVPVLQVKEYEFSGFKLAVNH
jgi:hypothetical protein